MRSKVSNGPAAKTRILPALAGSGEPAYTPVSEILKTMRSKSPEPGMTRVSLKDAIAVAVLSPALG
jgi:hypothetical protein